MSVEKVFIQGFCMDRFLSWINKNLLAMVLYLAGVGLQWYAFLQPGYLSRAFEWVLSLPWYCFPLMLVTGFVVLPFLSILLFCVPYATVSMLCSLFLPSEVVCSFGLNPVVFSVPD